MYTSVIIAVLLGVTGGCCFHTANKEGDDGGMLTALCGFACFAAAVVALIVAAILGIFFQ